MLLIRIRIDLVVWIQSLNSQSFYGSTSQLRHGVKVSSGMKLPMLHEISIQRHKVSSHSFPSLYFCLHKNRFWKLADRYKCVQPNRRDLPHPTPFPLWWGLITDYGVDYEIRWVIVNSGIGSHTPVFLWIQPQEGKGDPQKKGRKFIFWSAECFLSREVSPEAWTSLNGGLEMSKFHFSIQKYTYNFFSSSIFGHQNPGSGTGSA